MGGIGEREDVKGERGAKMEREGGIRGRRWRNVYTQKLEGGGKSEIGLKSDVIPKSLVENLKYKKNL